MSAGTTPVADPAARRRSRGRQALTALLAVVVAAVVVALLVGDPFASSGASSPGSVVDNADPTALATVTEGPLSSQEDEAGTLSYAARPGGSPYSIVNQVAGTITELPSVGQVVHRGQVLYRIADAPVVLLAGATPAYRTLSEGMSGPDVRQLNANLVALGYATRAEINPSSDYFGPDTADGLERLQGHLGVSETGSLALGQAVFERGSLRITSVTATLGATSGPGQPIVQATSTRRQVVVDLDASEQSNVHAGDRVQITLPNNRTTPGTVTSVGTVASGSSSGSPTIPVYIAPSDPRATGQLDQAPVQAQISTASVAHALILPVTALLALAGGGYAVETVRSGEMHELVPVTLGLFDDADGLVQVTGALSAGEHVVVPAL